MREELDFRVEARNTAAVAVTWAGQQRAVGGGASVTLPAVYEELCTEHVLVIEWLDGVSLRAAAQLIEDRGLDRAALSRALLGVDIAAEAHAYAADRVSGQMAPKAVKKTAADELAELLPVIRRLPRRFDRVTGALEQGRLGLNVRLFADERDRQVVTGLTNRFLLAFLGTASGIVAALLLGAAGGPKVAPTVSLYQIIGYNLLIVAAILVLRVLFTIFRNR
jgi:hypothetical protein